MADNKELKLKEDNLKVSGNGEPEKQRLETQPRSNHRPRINGMKIEYNECGWKTKKKKNLVNIVIYVSGLRKRMNVYSFFFLFVILSFPNDSEMVSMSYSVNVF